MTNDEFDRWVSGYRSRFHLVELMMANDETIQLDWFRCLGGFSLNDVNEATYEIMASEEQLFADRHLGRLLAICKRNGMKIGAEPKRSIQRQSETYRCQVCHDMGCLWVFHPMAYVAIEGGTFHRDRHLNDIVVGCSCPSGQQFINKPPPEPKDTRKAFPAMLRFDERKMLPVRDWEQNIDRDETDLIEFVSNLRHHNHKAEFDVFQ